LLFTEKAPSDTALVRDNDDFVTGILEPAQRGSGAIENLNLFRIGAVIGVVHNGAVAINEDGA